MLLKLQNIHAGYDEHEVLRDLTLEISPGERVALIGPNGAGKTTVLKAVMGLVKIRGQAILNGADISDLPVHARLEEGVSFVPQGRLVFPTLSVKENLEVGGYTLRDKSVLQKNMEEVLAYFPVLRTRFKARAGALSGGEQQMLAIGRALMTSPKLLMLDEPSLGLSPKVTHEVFEKLLQIHESGTALFIVEQNVRLVLHYAERGYLLAAGEVKASGTAAELQNEKLMHEAYLM